LATVLLTLFDGECSFSFLKQPCRTTYHGHIPGGQCQDSSGSNCDESAPLSSDLKCIGGDFTERWTLAFSIQDLDQKCSTSWWRYMMRCYFHQEVHTFLVKILCMVV